MKTAVLVVACVAGLTVFVSTSTGTPAVATCKPGEREVGGTTLQFHCGPGRATVRTGGRSFQIIGGTCGWRPAAALYMVDIGIKTLGPAKPTARFLEIRTAHKRPGTYDNVGIAFQVGRKQYSLGRSKVTIAKDLKHGTFSGLFLFGTGSARGSWSC